MQNCIIFGRIPEKLGKLRSEPSGKISLMPCAQLSTVKKNPPLRERNITRKNLTSQNVQPRITFAQRVKEHDQQQHNVNNTIQAYQQNNDMVELKEVI